MKNFLVYLLSPALLLAACAPAVDKPPTPSAAAPVDEKVAEKPVDAPTASEPVTSPTSAADSDTDAEKVPAEIDDAPAAVDPPPSEEKPAPPTPAMPEPVAPAQDAAPKKVSKGAATLNLGGGKKPPVSFDHRGHQKRSDCATCHHKTAEGAQPKACTSCHGKLAKAPDMKIASHKRCTGCHKQAKKGPIKCADCHVK